MAPFRLGISGHYTQVLLLTKAISFRSKRRQWLPLALAAKPWNEKRSHLR